MNPLLAYQESGTGFPVLFLHGFCESKAIWQGFTEPFSASSRVIAVDLPGFGESTPNTHYASIEDMAGQVNAFVEQLNLARFMVVAHSLGGYVALALAEKYPEKMAGLCLFHSTALPDSEEKKQSRNKTAAFIEQNGVPPFIENFVPPLFYKGRHAEMQAPMYYAKQIGRTTPTATAAGVTRAMRDRPDRRHVLQKATYPVLFIAGKNDEAVPFETAREQFFLPAHALVQVLDQVAHMGMFERKDETQLMVSGFIALCRSLAERVH